MELLMKVKKMSPIGQTAYTNALRKLRRIDVDYETEETDEYMIIKGEEKI